MSLRKRKTKKREDDNTTKNNLNFKNENQNLKNNDYIINTSGTNECHYKKRN